MLWSEAIERYFSERDVCHDYERGTRKRAAALDLFAGRPLDVTEVTSVLVNAFLAALQAEGRYYEKTVKGYRDAIMAVWRAAWESGLTPHRPERVKSIKVRRKLPQAWSIEEVRALVAASRDLRGRVCGLKGVSRAIWFESYVQLLWCTGLRAGDLIRLEWDTVSPGGIVGVVQSKTRHQLICQLSPRALALAQDIRIRTESPLVLPWPGARCILDRWFRRLVKAAGIREGGTRRIRRAAASYVEKTQPGMAGRFLGHLTAGLASRHYLDPSITHAAAVTPPEL